MNSFDHVTLLFNIVRKFFTDKSVLFYDRDFRYYIETNYRDDVLLSHSVMQDNINMYLNDIIERANENTSSR